MPNLPPERPPDAQYEHFRAIKDIMHSLQVKRLRMEISRLKRYCEYFCINHEKEG